jgi:hypothetical protein
MRDNGLGPHFVLSGEHIAELGGVTDVPVDRGAGHRLLGPLGRAM